MANELTLFMNYDTKKSIYATKQRKNRPFLNFEKSTQIKFECFDMKVNRIGCRSNVNLSHLIRFL